MTATTTKPSVPPPAGPRPPLFKDRPDIDALKVIATVLVIFSLAELPGFGGGFVGYDVFFVIVGFLTVRRLYSEVMTTREVDINRWFRARLGRLYPPLVIVSVVTLVASVPLVSKYFLQEVAIEAASSVVFVSNMVIARRAGGFFNADVRDSPLLATWSVSTVAQFLVIAGILFALTIPLIDQGRSRAIVRPVILYTCGAIVVLFGGFAAYLTYTARAWAFFTLGGRLWEFALGGALALIALPAFLRGRFARIAVTVVGLAVVLGSAAAATKGWLYPVPMGLLPVAGTVLVLLAGDERFRGKSPFKDMLGGLHLRQAGRFAYGWYLTSYPAMVLLMLAMKDESLPVRLAALGASFVVCLLVGWLVGAKVHERVQRTSLPRLIIGAGVTVALTVVIASVVGVRGESMDAYESVRSQLEVGAGDRQPPCTEATSESGIRYCTNGAVNGEGGVMLIGDERVKTWQRAMGDATGEFLLPLVDRRLDGCPATPMRVQADDAKAQKCADFRKETERLIKDLGPRVVVVAQSDTYLDRIVADDGSRMTVEQKAAGWTQKTSDLLNVISAAGSHPAFIQDYPTLPRDPVQCMRKNKALSPCTYSMQEVATSIFPLQYYEAMAAGQRGAQTVGSFLTICGKETCTVVVDDTLVYASDDQLAPKFVSQQIPLLVRMLRKSGA